MANRKIDSGYQSFPDSIQDWKSSQSKKFKISISSADNSETINPSSASSIDIASEHQPKPKNLSTSKLSEFGAQVLKGISSIVKAVRFSNSNVSSSEPAKSTKVVEVKPVLRISTSSAYQKEFLEADRPNSKYIFSNITKNLKLSPEDTTPVYDFQDIIPQSAISPENIVKVAKNEETMDKERNRESKGELSKKRSISMSLSNENSPKAASLTLTKILQKLIPDSMNSEQKQFWMNDERCEECYECKLPFTTFRRRHHCRICGLIFCLKCANVIIPKVELGLPKNLRVCNYCSQLIYDNKAFTDVEVKDDEHHKNLQGNLSSFLFQEMRKLTSANTTSSSMTEINPSQETLLYNTDKGISLSSLDLPQFYLTEQKSSIKRTSQSGSRSPKVARKHRLRGTRNSASSLNIFSPTYADENKSPTAEKKEIPNLPFLEAIASQLVEEAGIKDQKEWKTVLVDLCSKLFNDIEPHLYLMNLNEEMDIRQFIKIKKIIHSKKTPSDSKVIKGILFSKNVIHKKMKQSIKNPKVMLIGFPIEFSRTENQYLSMAPIIAQEEEHLKNLVNRIVSYKPNIVLAEKTVSHSAIKFFLENNITLVRQIKPQIMETLSRALKAEIISSIDRFIIEPKPEIGQCETFKVEQFHSKLQEHKEKSLMYFENCGDNFTFSIALYGQELPELIEIKRILYFLIYTMYNIYLESKIRIFDRIDFKVGSDPISPHGKILSVSPYSDLNQLSTTTSSTLRKCQTIRFLYTTLTTEDRALCGVPEIKKFEYYKDGEDITLGNYIRNLVKTRLFICPNKGCDKELGNHIHTWVHASKRISVVITNKPDDERKSDQVMESDQLIYIITECNDCQSKSKASIANFEQYSFSKYLENLIFNKLQGLKCGTDEKHQFYCYFEYERVHVEMVIEQIELHKVELETIEFADDEAHNQITKSKEYEEIKTNIAKYYLSLEDRIKALINENDNPDEAKPTTAENDEGNSLEDSHKNDSAKQFFTSQLEKCQFQLDFLLKKLSSIYESTPSKDISSMNEVLILFKEYYAQWELDWIEISKIYSEYKKQANTNSISSFKALFEQVLKTTFNKKKKGQVEKKQEFREDETEKASDSQEIVKETTDENNENGENNSYSGTPSFVGTPIEREPYKKQRPSLLLIDELYHEDFDIEDFFKEEPTFKKDEGKTEKEDKLLQPEVEKFRIDKTPPSSMPSSSSLFMRTLTTLWTGNQQFLPLEYSLTSNEHFFKGSNIIVRDDEPSSIVSFTLTSEEYKQKISLLKGNSTNEELLKCAKGSHIKFHDSAQFLCRIYYPEQFEAIRNITRCDLFYSESLSRCFKWQPQGGKSGVTFLKSKDDKFILKQLSRSEIDAFLSFSDSYFKYMYESFFKQLPTMLAKIFGVYRIAIRNAGGKSVKMDFLIMENVFYEKKVSQIFDLKGSIRNRHVLSTGRDSQVLKDENLISIIAKSPIYINEQDRNLIQSSIWNDTLFLSKLNVMDYSILVGIDDQEKKLIMGIVDFIRTFTWDKKLESWVKESGILGGGGKEPTIVSPSQYKNRFREAIGKYFLMVPHILSIVNRNTMLAQDDDNIEND